MSKIQSETITRWSKMASNWLKEAGDPGSLTDIYLGSEAWAIAHRCGITSEAYQDQTIVDAHIVTALKNIFPNANFKDRYSY